MGVYLCFLALYELHRMAEMCFFLSISPSLSHSISRLFSQENKNCSSHSDREQRKTWPGPVTFGASWLVEAQCVSFVAVWTARQAVLWALPWTQSYLSSPVRADLNRRLKAVCFFPTPVTHFVAGWRETSVLRFILTSVWQGQQMCWCNYLAVHTLLFLIFSERL